MEFNTFALSQELGIEKWINDGQEGQSTITDEDLKQLSNSAPSNSPLCF